MEPTMRSTGRRLLREFGRPRPHVKAAEEHGVDGDEHDGGNGHGEQHFNERKCFQRAV